MTSLHTKDLFLIAEGKVQLEKPWDTKREVDRHIRSYLHLDLECRLIKL